MPTPIQCIDKYINKWRLCTLCTLGWKRNVIIGVSTKMVMSQPANLAGIIVTPKGVFFLIFLSNQKGFLYHQRGGVLVSFRITDAKNYWLQAKKLKL